MYEKFYKDGWEDLPSENTPITSEVLEHMEDGISQNSKDISDTSKEVDTINSDFTKLTIPALVVTTTTNEITLLSRTIAKKGIYMLTGLINVNNYGLQDGRELNTGIKLNGGILNLHIVVVNSGEFSRPRPVALMFEVTSDNSALSVTIRSSTAKQFAVNASELQLLRLK